MLAALALAAAQPAGLTGLYRSNEIEVGAELELQPGGRFRYALDYGAVSETGEGVWSSDGSTVRLTSRPMPRLPRFVLVRDDPAPPGEVRVKIAPPGLNWPAPLKVEVSFAGAPPIVLRTDSAGRLPLQGKIATVVKPLVPIYESGTAPVALAAGRGHRLLFRFEPNDLGTARFDREPLTIDGDTLILRRYDRRIRFTREDQRPR
jgi:hypothetical protein